MSVAFGVAKVVARSKCSPSDVETPNVNTHVRLDVLPATTHHNGYVAVLLGQHGGFVV